MTPGRCATHRWRRKGVNGVEPRASVAERFVVVVVEHREEIQLGSKTGKPVCTRLTRSSALGDRVRDNRTDNNRRARHPACSLCSVSAEYQAIFNSFLSVFQRQLVAEFSTSVARNRVSLTSACFMDLATKRVTRIRIPKRNLLNMGKNRAGIFESAS